VKGRGSSERHVALLRGINVGGKNKLAMKDLSRMFLEAGCSDVVTYIQSGNVVFRAPPRVAGRLPSIISSRIADEIGNAVPVLLRTAEEIGSIANGNPFLEAGADVAVLHVVFLADPPGARAASALDPRRSPPDCFIVRGREIYLSCPNGMARTKLTNNYFDSRLATTSTIRNWRTVLRLVEMAGA